MYRSILILTSVLFLTLAVDASASSGGVTRRSQLTTPGCGTASCHGAMPSTSVVISVASAVDGKITVAAGSTTALTLVVAHPSQKAAGTNISVNTELNGMTSAGTLSAGLTSGLRFTQGQLTHSLPRSFVDGEVKFNFSWTAPQEEGTYYLHAAVNSVNLNGVPSGDVWNWLEPVEITVSGTSSVSEALTTFGSASISPVPAHGEVTVSAPVTAGEPLTIQIMDASGSVVRTEQVTSNTDHLVYVWDGRMNNGSLAPVGAYSVAVMGDRRVYTGRALIVR